MNIYASSLAANPFADLNEQKEFLKFVEKINQVLKQKKAKQIDTLEIEGLKRDWKLYLQDSPEIAHEQAAQDILMIRDHEEMMLQKFMKDYDQYLETKKVA